MPFFQNIASKIRVHSSFIVKRTLAFALAYVPVMYTIDNAIVSVAQITGKSMLPTLAPEEDMVLIQKLAFKPHRGDVVVLKDPRRAEGAVLKRLIALEGDVVEVEEGPGGLQHIPQGYCWVEGDNHDASIDSRVYGPIPMGMLLGKVSWVIWPFSHIRKIPSKPRLLPYTSHYGIPPPPNPYPHQHREYTVN